MNNIFLVWSLRVITTGVLLYSSSRVHSSLPSFLTVFQFSTLYAISLSLFCWNLSLTHLLHGGNLFLWYPEPELKEGRSLVQPNTRKLFVPKSRGCLNSLAPASSYTHPKRTPFFFAVSASLGPLFSFSWSCGLFVFARRELYGFAFSHASEISIQRNSVSFVPFFPFFSHRRVLRIADFVRAWMLVGR